jgi:hypothetical protein
MMGQISWPRIRPWREMAALGILVMGLSWAVPWFRSLTQSTYELSSAYTFVVLGGVVLIAYLLVRALTHLRLNLLIRRVSLGVMLVMNVFVGLKTLLYETENISLADLAVRPLYSFADAAGLIPDEFIIILTVLLACNWGVHLAQENIEPLRVIRSFQTGLVMFFFYIVANTFVTGETYGNMANLFVFAGLMGMGAARVDTLSTLRGGRENPFDRRWLAGMILAGLGAVGTAAFFAAQVSGEDTLLGILPRIVIGGALALVFLAAAPLFLLGYYLLFLIVQNLSPESELAENLNQLLIGLQNFSRGFLEFLEKYVAPVAAFFSRFVPFIKSGILWGVVIVLMAGIILALVIRERRRRTSLADDRQSIFGEMNLLDLLRDAWRKRLDAAAALFARAADMRRSRQMLAAARIRKIYAELMDLCDDLHHPRPMAITPLEFLPALDRLFPTSIGELETITNAYLKVRYGELPETRGEVEVVEEAWKRVKESRAVEEKRRRGEKQ